MESSATSTNQDTPLSNRDKIEFEKLGGKFKFYGYMLLLTLIIGVFASIMLVWSIYSMVYGVGTGYMTPTDFASGLINLVIMVNATNFFNFILLSFAVITVLKVASYFKMQYKGLYFGFITILIYYLLSLSYIFVFTEYLVTNFSSLVSEISSVIQNAPITTDPNSVFPSYFANTNKIIDFVMVIGLILIYKGFLELIDQHRERKALENIPLLLIITIVLEFIGIFVSLAAVLATILLIYIFIKAGKAIENPPIVTTPGYAVRTY